MQRYDLLNTPCLHIQNEQQAKQYIESLVTNGTGGYSVAINAEKIMLYNNDKTMKQLIDKALLQTPDGAGAVLAMKWLYGRNAVKLDLPRLMLQIADEHKLKLFILGAVEEVNAAACQKIAQQYQNAQVVGRLNGYFKDLEEAASLISATSPQVVFVALGSPRQELISTELSKLIPSALFIGCGGALDVLAGKVRRAPRFFVNNNLEWFYRLARQPSRIKRQKVLPLFFFKLLAAVAMGDHRSNSNR